MAENQEQSEPPIIVGPGMAGSMLPSQAPRQKLRHPNPAPVKTPIRKPPRAEDVPCRPRGTGEEGVYWGGNRWYYDDGSEVEKPKGSRVGRGIHPKVQARLDREEANKALTDHNLRMHRERIKLQQERAALEAEKKAFRARQRFRRA